MGDHRPCHTGRAALVAFPGAVGSTQCANPAAIVTIHRPAGPHPLVGVHRGYAITATATKTYLGARYETSEFSKCIYYPRQHPDGTLIRPPGSQNIFLVENGTNRQIGSSQVMASYNMSASEIKSATSGDTGAPGGGNGLYLKEGTLVKGSGSSVYVIDQTGANTFIKRKITSLNAFNGLGYTSADIIYINDSALPSSNGTDISDSSSHPDGTLVKRNDGTLYLIESNLLRLVGSPSIFISHRFTNSKIKNMTTGDTLLSGGTNLSVREGVLIKGSSPTIYVVDIVGGVTKKRQIGSIQAFTELGYTNSDVITIPNNELPVLNGLSL